MARLSQKLGRGELLRNLGPRLRSAKELPESQVNELLAQAELEEIRALGERGDPAAVEAAWNALPRNARRLPQAIVLRARARMDGGAHADAERELRDLIEETGDAAALRLYGELVLPDPLVPLERAENWLRKRPDDPELLATCARLCLRGGAHRQGADLSRGEPRTTTERGPEPAARGPARPARRARPCRAGAARCARPQRRPPPRSTACAPAAPLERQHVE